MKKKSLRYAGLGLFLTAGLLLAGCGASSTKETAAVAVTEEAAYDVAPEAEMVMEENGITDTGAGYSTEAQVQDIQRKLIKNVNLYVETESFEELLLQVEDKTKGFDGYVESCRVYKGNRNYSGLQNANFTLRIPAERLDEFLSAVSEISNVISKDENVTDVTLQYVDMESHKEALQTEQERLLALLKQAETVEDIITIEGRLSEVRYQIESMEAQLRTLDNQVSYSTVYLYIEEVKRLTPAEEQSAWEKISTGFVRNVYKVGEGFQNFLIGLMINLPYLAAAAVIILAVLFIVRTAVKRSERKKNKEAAKKRDTEKEKTEEAKKQDTEKEKAEEAVKKETKEK